MVIILFCKADTNITFSLQEKTHLLETSFCIGGGFCVAVITVGEEFLIKGKMSVLEFLAMLSFSGAIISGIQVCVKIILKQKLFVVITTLLKILCMYTLYCDKLLVEMEWDWLSGKHLSYKYIHALHNKDVQHFLVGLFFLNNEPML